MNEILPTEHEARVSQFRAYLARITCVEDLFPPEAQGVPAALPKVTPPHLGCVALQIMERIQV
jgi:hypothetical protein